jgi:hypothetical protein
MCGARNTLGGGDIFLGEWRASSLGRCVLCREPQRVLIVGPGR